MRKLILTTALVLMSVSAQAGQTRGLVLASNEAPRMTVAEQVKALDPEPPAAQKVEAKVESKSEAAVVVPKAEAKPKVGSESGSQAKPVSKKRETDEQKARRIAARYGISW